MAWIWRPHFRSHQIRVKPNLVLKDSDKITIKFGWLKVSQKFFICSLRKCFQKVLIPFLPKEMERVLWARGRASWLSEDLALPRGCFRRAPGFHRMLDGDDALVQIPEATREVYFKSYTPDAHLNFLKKQINKPTKCSNGTYILVQCQTADSKPINHNYIIILIMIHWKLTKVFPGELIWAGDLQRLRCTLGKCSTPAAVRTWICRRAR